jgi:hypothetical protein
LAHAVSCVRSLMILTAALLAVGGLQVCSVASEAPAGPSEGRHNGDYLDVETRRAVEELKAAVQAEPTTDATGAERALVLFDWINAYARAGGYVPVNAPTVVAQINGYGLPAGAMLDQFVAELSLLDERPDALGSLTVNTSESFEARSHATFQQIYTVGAAPVQAGGGFLVAKHFQANHGAYQTHDPRAPGYLTITSSNPRASFVEERFDVPGMHGGFRGAAPQIVFRVADADLAQGDQVTLTYGDTSGGSPGLRMPDFSSDQMPFPVYVDLDGSNLWLSLPIQPIRVHGAAVAGVQGFAPSIVGTGERFDISIRAEDPYGNRATGEIPDWTLMLDDRPMREVRHDDQAVTLVSGLSFAEAGVYRIKVRSADGTLAGAVNPVLVQDHPSRRIYWGDTHGHSGFAEGIGSADAFMRFARDDARLDFVTHSEHDIWMDDGEWEILREMVKQYSEDGRFVAFLGYEWTMRQTQGGHHNVLFRTPDGRERVPAQRFPTLSSLYHGLRNRYDVEDVLIIPHAHQAADYRHSDPELEHLVEIMSMHGTFEWFARMYLSHGHRVGFVAASDDHIGRPGYASPKSDSLAQRGGLGAVFAAERTADGIFDAMKALSAYATTGERIILDVGVNGTAMGQRAPYADSRAISGRVIGTAPIRSVSLFRNDAEIHRWAYGEPQADRLQVSFYSDSRPYHPGDNPRGWRHWQGTMRVHGAVLEAAEASDFDNLSTQRLEIDSEDANLVHFATHTRGDYSSVVLDLDAMTAETRIEVELQDAAETGSGPPSWRRHQMIRGGSVVLHPGAIGDGPVVHTMTVDGYDDTITLAHVRAMPAQAAFEFTDEDDPQRGDYYFIRVRQNDDALAWSSPIWIGGYRPQ